ncbi:MAG: hypothetical protein AVDCRST_MAG43-567 [uncultured Thermomicrobiales bacterium]|uniref:Uncharacterized protein n=1 Tax=uncultured Thermomicrobiales bacterium TaxID=1645740 RepID=A0A6J4UCJ0_9BACT|nr:MAG: hypothetical protein AVDCRST_MAG43-567 [uncultured Thermomicrobiales bacterium]
MVVWQLAGQSHTTAALAIPGSAGDFDCFRPAIGVPFRFQRL